VDTGWVWSVDYAEFLLVFGDLLNGRIRVDAGFLDNWRVLDDDWLSSNDGLLLETATALLPLAPSTFLLSSDLLQSILLGLEAFDEVEVSGNEGDTDGHDNGVYKTHN